ncbi:MAG: thiamine pyrophosphate-dependent enzyme, partial [Sulfolobales archaeon]
MKLPIKFDVELYGDAKKVLNMLVEGIKEIGVKVSRVSWISRVKELKEYYSKYYYVDDGGLRPWKVLKVIREVVPSDSIITTGVGKHQMWVTSFWEVLKPRTLITSGGMGTMGFGLPAAIGAKIARPDKVVINLDGDGSFLMTMNNLATAVDYNIPIITVVFDNRSLGLVRQVQELFFRGRVVGVDFGPSTDYVKLAESFGAVGYDVTDYNDLRESLKKALNDSVASVIRIPIDRDEFALPQLPPGGSLREVILCDPRKGC